MTFGDSFWERATTDKLLNWGMHNFQDLPWRKSIPFWTAIVAEVMLQRTRSQQVVPAFKKLRQVYPSAVSFGAASHIEIADLMRPLGLHWRAPLLKQLASAMAKKKGRLPRDQKLLMQLPLVGDYVSAAALSFHGGQRAVIIDSNVVRVISRLIGKPYTAETRRQRWLLEQADRLTPSERFKDYNYAILDLAHSICTPRVPHCDICPLSDSCRSSNNYEIRT